MFAGLIRDEDVPAWSEDSAGYILSLGEPAFLRCRVTSIGGQRWEAEIRAASPGAGHDRPYPLWSDEYPTEKAALAAVHVELCLMAELMRRAAERGGLDLLGARPAPSEALLEGAGP